MDNGLSAEANLKRFASAYPELAAEARSKAGELAVMAAPAGNAAVYDALLPLTERPYHLDRPVDDAGWALFWGGYYDLLASFPAAALVKGVQAWEMTGGKRFFPTPSELFPHVEKAAEPIRVAAYRAERLTTLSAPARPREQTPEEKAAAQRAIDEALAALNKPAPAAQPVARTRDALNPNVLADLQRRAQDPIPRKGG